MFVLRLRVCHPSGTKSIAEVLVEAHPHCCLDGRCDTPAWGSYERQGITHAPDATWAARETALETLVATLTAQLGLSRANVAGAAHSTSRDDFLLAETAEHLSPGAMF